MNILIYWKQIVISILVIIIFFLGYYTKYLQYEAAANKKLYKDIEIANEKILDNNKIYNEYSKIVSNIMLEDNKKLEVNNEKDINCIIPDKWVQYLNSSN